MSDNVSESPWRRVRSLLPVLACGSMSMVALADTPGPAFAQVGLDRSLEVIDEFLTKHLDFSGSQVASVHKGTIVTTDLPGGDPREVVVAGALRIQVSPEFFVDRVRDVADFRRGENVRAVGALSRPPAMDDFEQFVLDREDLDDLRGCRVGRCPVKFDADTLTRLGSEVDWSAPAAREQANGIVRETLYEYARGYAERGRLALPIVRDRADPVSRREESEALIGRTRIFDGHFLALPIYLAAFPTRTDERAEDLFYWSQEVFGLKPVANLTHMTIWREPAAGAVAAIVSQQLYASHYFDGSLGLTVLFPDPASDGAGAYVVYVNRTLGDALQGGWFAGIKRAIARGRARDGLANTLRALRGRLESLARDAPT